MLLMQALCIEAVRAWHSGGQRRVTDRKQRKRKQRRTAYAWARLGVCWLVWLTRVKFVCHKTAGFLGLKVHRVSEPSVSRQSSSPSNNTRSPLRLGCSPQIPPPRSHSTAPLSLPLGNNLTRLFGHVVLHAASHQGPRSLLLLAIHH
jgi:hypothetical protein